MPAINFNHGYLSVAGLAGGPSFQLLKTNSPAYLLTNNSADQGGVALQSASPCAAGQQSLAATFAGDQGLGFGYAEAGGNVYQRLYYTGVLNFSGHVMLTNTPLSQIIVVGAFKMSGNLQGFLNNPFVGDPGPAVFDSPVSGKGKAVVEMSTSMPLGAQVFTLVRLTYHFL